MTEQEINTWIAEKVMGWHYTHKSMDNGLLYNSWRKDGVVIMPIGDFDPYNDTAQAIEALEAWCDAAGEDGRMWSIRRNPNGTVEASLYNGSWGDRLLAQITTPNIAHAICDALVTATGGE